MRTLKLGLIGACGFVLTWSTAWAWQININGTAQQTDQGSAVKVDAAGDVVAAGYTNDSGTGNDFTVVKAQGGSGAELWRYVLNGSANGDDQALAVAVDPAGDVVAAGYTNNTGTSSDFTVVKLQGSSGAELWRRVIDGHVTGDYALSVAVDSAGDMVIGGTIYARGFNAPFTIVKLHGNNGAELWRRSLITSLPLDMGAAYAVRVDAAGDVVAAGRSSRRASSYFTVFKLNGSSGAELWRYVVGTGASAFGVTVDNAGDVVAAGEIIVAPTGVINSYFTVTKLKGTSGAELWRRLIEVPAFYNADAAYAVAVDAQGDVVAGGRTQAAETGSSATDFSVIKLRGSDGAELWRFRITPDPSYACTGCDSARAVAVDAAGDVIASGATSRAVTSEDFTVVKLNGSNGAEVWRYVIPSDTVSDAALAVAVDTAGNVIAAGGANDDFTVVKLRGTDGGSF